MSNMKKQLKITKLLRKKGGRKLEDFDNSQQTDQNEIKELELKLINKQNELFQLQRDSYRHKVSPLKMKAEPFIRPQKIILENSIETLKKNLSLMSMLSGIEVQSYVADDHCCVVYHMQHDSEHKIKHGLRINLKSGKNEVSKVSFPLGFNFNAVMEDIDNIMAPHSLGAIRKALVAYYDRLEQYDALKRMLTLEAQLSKYMDGSHMEISFVMEDFTAHEEIREHIQVVLVLDYRVYDIRPKTYNFRDTDLPEEVLEMLRSQCALLKKKPLATAFREAFIDSIGPYKVVEQFADLQVKKVIRRPKKRFRPNKRHYNEDDTFHPEDCSERSDDDIDE